MNTREKKIATVSWEEIIMEAMTALTDGRSDVEVPAEEMYRWIESTEYLTDKGRSADPAWSDGRYPSYQASLQLKWQRMVQAGRLSRTSQGVYRLNQPMTAVARSAWAELLSIDQDISDPQVQRSNVRRIRRSQRLRDSLTNYYRSRCQVCGENSPHLIPTEIPGRYYVEVHHVSGLAESYALQQEGLLVGLRVNGLGNLTVLCPHHHATIHHHWPRYEFDRLNLLWRHTSGGTLLLNHLTAEHATSLKFALV